MTPQDTVNKLREEIRTELLELLKIDDMHDYVLETFANKVAALTARAFTSIEQPFCSDDTEYSQGYKNGKNHRILEEQVLADLIEKL